MVELVQTAFDDRCYRKGVQKKGFIYVLIFHVRNNTDLKSFRVMK